MFSSREDICFDGCGRAFGVLKSPAISESRVVLSLLRSEFVDRASGQRLNLVITTSQFATARHVLVVKSAQFHFCGETHMTEVLAEGLDRAHTNQGWATQRGLANDVDWFRN